MLPHPLARALDVSRRRTPLDLLDDKLSVIAEFEALHQILALAARFRDLDVQVVPAGTRGSELASEDSGVVDSLELMITCGPSPLFCVANGKGQVPRVATKEREEDE